MTAEEYLNSKRIERYYPGYTYYVVNLEVALKALEMARNEEREKAKQQNCANGLQTKLQTEPQTDLFKQAVIASLQGYSANPNDMLVRMDVEQIVELSINQAQKLIETLDRYEGEKKDRL